jgi:hypothetical protein
MFNKALFNKEIEEKENNKEFTEEDYEQINKEISKALFEMKKEKENDELEEDINEAEKEKELNNFDYDFFSDKSSISNDNMSDISENSFKSANVEMNRNNSLKFNMMNNNFKNNNNNINNFSGITKDVSNSSKDGANESFKLKKSSFNSEQNDRINNIQNNILNLENHNNSFNGSPFLINLGNNQLLKNNFINETNNLNINNNINNNPNIQLINNINNNQNCNRNNQPIINNNLNFLNVNTNYFNNNNALNNINIINYNNNINNNQFLINHNNNSNSFISFPPISEKVLPGIYNLDSPKNIINLDNILKSRDKRTTLIIRNIPNKYTISLLLDELNRNFENKFDIVYLPQDYINNSNLGFGFINFVNHMHLILFYDEFVGKKWNCFNSKKRCQLAYSKYQGKNELMKYIHTKLGISNLDNNNENIKKSFFINNNKNLRAPIEMPIKYYSNFISFYPHSLCHIKDDKVFIIDKYYNI